MKRRSGRVKSHVRVSSTTAKRKIDAAMQASKIGTRWAAFGRRGRAATTKKVAQASAA
jgi:hypothetical protein